MRTVPAVQVVEIAHPLPGSPEAGRLRRAMELAIDALAAFDAGARDFTATRVHLAELEREASARGESKVVALAAQLSQVVFCLDLEHRLDAGEVFAHAVRWRWPEELG